MVAARSPPFPPGAALWRNPVTLHLRPTTCGFSRKAYTRFPLKTSLMICHRWTALFFFQITAKSSKNVPNDLYHCKYYQHTWKWPWSLCCKITIWKIYWTSHSPFLHISLPPCLTLFFPAFLLPPFFLFFLNYLFFLFSSSPSSFAAIDSLCGFLCLGSWHLRVPFQMILFIFMYWLICYKYIYKIMCFDFCGECRNGFSLVLMLQ